MAKTAKNPADVFEPSNEMKHALLFLRYAAPLAPVSRFILPDGSVIVVARAPSEDDPDLEDHTGCLADWYDGHALELDELAHGSSPPSPPPPPPPDHEN